jgi:dephospho-CoA kinase
MRKAKQLILVLVGEKLSGKEMASKYLVHKYKFTSYRFSAWLVKILDILGLPITRVNEMNLISALRERFGGGVLAETLKNIIIKQKKARVVIDGLRHPGEYDILKTLPGFRLVYVTASLATRYQRAKKRGEKVGENKFTLQEFKQEEKLPTEIYIKRLGHKADVKIENNSSLNDLYKQLEDKVIKTFCK